MCIRDRDNLGFTDNYIECMIPTSGVYPIATANDKEQITVFTAHPGWRYTPPWKRNGRECARPSDGWWKGLWARTLIDFLLPLFLVVFGG